MMWDEYINEVILQGGRMDNLKAGKGSLLRNGADPALLCEELFSLKTGRESVCRGFFSPNGCAPLWAMYRRNVAVVGLQVPLLSKSKDESRSTPREAIYMTSIKIQPCVDEIRSILLSLTRSWRSKLRIFGSWSGRGMMMTMKMWW